MHKPTSGLIVLVRRVKFAMKDTWHSGVGSQNMVVFNVFFLELFVLDSVLL